MKPNSKRNAATSKLVAIASGLKLKHRTAPALKQHPRAGSESKQARVIEMLRTTEGATIATIMKATGWQQHSVRGFFAGVVRKKLKLHLVSVKSNGARVYRIVRTKPGRTGQRKRRAAAN